MGDGLLIKRLVSFLESRQLHSGAGDSVVKLTAREHQGVTVVILYIQETLLRTKKPIRNIFMLECLLQNRKTISHDSQIFFLVNTQIIKLFQTLDLDLITNEKDFLVCWNSVIEEKSLSLWYSAKTDCVDLDSNCYSGSSYKTIQNSWFMNKVIKPQNKSLQKIFLPFYKSLLADGMESGSTPLIRTRKYKLRLNSLQKKILEKHRHNYRYCYNKAVSLINGRSDIVSDTTDAFSGKIEKKASCVNYSKFDLRNIIVPAECNSRTPWLLQSGSNIRSQAVFEAHSRFKTCISNITAGNINHFELKYKTKKSNSWTMDIDKSNITTYETPGNKTGFSLYEETGVIHTTEKFEINKDCKIHFDGRNYFIVVPYEKKKTTVDINKHYFCALDPGSRKFQTLYSPEEEVINIGERASDKLYALLLNLDTAVSKKNKKLETKLRIRILNLQNELHNKVSRFLCENYQNILIPKLTKENDIISKKNRKIKTKTVRQMVVLGHCKFVEKLKTKASEYADVQVKVVTEEYTSQTCLKCHRLTKTSSETYKCNHCLFQIDRDLLGSRNILLKDWNLLKIQKC